MEKKHDLTHEPQTEQICSKCVQRETAYADLDKASRALVEVAKQAISELERHWERCDDAIEVAKKLSLIVAQIEEARKV